MRKAARPSCTGTVHRRRWSPRLELRLPLQMPDFLEALPKALNRKWSADVQSVGPDGGSSSDSLVAQEVA